MHAELPKSELARQIRPIARFPPRALGVPAVSLNAPNATSGNVENGFGRRQHNIEQMVDVVLRCAPEACTEFCPALRYATLRGGQRYSEKECYAKAITMDPNQAEAWGLLGIGGGGARVRKLAILEPPPSP
eukprot:6269666-Amphidinium_carterae.2